MDIAGLVPPGVTFAKRGFPKELLEGRSLKLSRAATLQDLEPEYVFYTPALLYLFVRLQGREPFNDFLTEYGKPVYPFTLKFDKPIFRGLEIGTEPHWNHVLYAMEREHAASYVKWMLLNAFLDQELGVLSRVRYKNIRIADPIKLEKSAVLPSKPPLAEILVFCLETSRGCFYIQAGVNPILDLPYLVADDVVFEDTAVFAKALQEGHLDPYAAAEAAITPPGKTAAEAEMEQRLRQRGPLREPTKIDFDSLSDARKKELLEAISQLDRGIARRRG